MNTKLIRIFLMLTVSVFLLSACMAGARNPSGTVSTVLPTINAVESTAVLTPRPTKTPRPAPTATQDPIQAQAQKAEEAASAYFEALAAGNMQQAADMLSTYSLVVFQMTRGDAVSALNLQSSAGTAWSDYKLLGSSAFDDQTFLVQVQFTQKGLDAQKQAIEETREEVWPFRLETGEWRYNWSNLIDYRTLSVDPQSLNGLTLKPVQINRFTDRIQLVLLAQNRTSQPIVLGQVNEILGTFYFAEQSIEVEKTQIILNPQRTIMDMKLEVKGEFKSFPSSIEIRKWKTYNVTPWFVFQLN